MYVIDDLSEQGAVIENTRIKFGINNVNISTIAHWRLVGAVFSPNIIMIATKPHPSVTNVVLS